MKTRSFNALLLLFNPFSSPPIIWTGFRTITKMGVEVVNLSNDHVIILNDRVLNNCALYGSGKWEHNLIEYFRRKSQHAGINNIIGIHINTHYNDPHNKYQKNEANRLSIRMAAYKKLRMSKLRKQGVVEKK